ncbi:MAG TPA: toll/interleukin-1 receptor domain-containing protein [Allosphingosinicella sp.]
MDQGSGHYTAFLSYSHKDAAAARWLHRRLETYRIPRRLVGTEGERGPVPARLIPIFRDREELPAAGDLSERVRAALAISDNLIILCSPYAAASPWVAKEIAVFRELHPDRPIFAAVVDGEPVQCFPPNLAANGAEPLAADLRPGRDGRRFGFLKLLAGLSGIGLDALVQRDAQRRMRRVTAVTGTALAATLVMAVTTGIALSERREAQRQRAEAEGLVEFMLTDLRDRLKKVGPLDVLTAVNRRAIAYYQRQDLNRLSDDSLARRARVLQAMGEDDEKLGHIDRVLIEAQEASRTTSALVAKDPYNAQRIYDDAQSRYWVGRVYELRHDWPTAEHQYNLYADSARKLVALEPRNSNYMMEMGWSTGNLGSIRINGTRDYLSAQKSFEESIYWFSRAAETAPNKSAALLAQGNSYGGLAESYFARNLWRPALNGWNREYQIVESLRPSDPENIEIPYKLAIARRAAARSLIHLGDLGAARSSISDAYSQATLLTRKDPHNAEWLLFRTMIECDLLFSGVGHPPGVRASTLVHKITLSARSLLAEGNPHYSELDTCTQKLHTKN